MRIGLRLWGPPLAWMAILFWLASSPPPASLPRWVGWDKVQHAGAYGLLAALLWRALRGTWPPLPSWGVFLGAACITSAYGALTEVYQAFLPQRAAEGWDWVADTVGGLVALMGLQARRRHRSEAILSIPFQEEESCPP